MASNPARDESLLTGKSRWERGMDTAIRVISYPLLALSLGAVLLSRSDTEHRMIAVGLAVAAAAWTWFMFTSKGVSMTGARWPVYTYFAGFVALAGVMVWHDLLFFIFAISGFFHAFLIRPWTLSFVGVGATSVIVNSTMVRFDPDSAQIWLFAIIVVIQTLAIGFGVMGGEKVSELAEERRIALAELDRAMQENAGLHAQLVAQAREAGILDERQRMAGEIHDTISQGLTGVITQLEAARQTADDAEADRHVDNAVRLARDSLTEARRSVRALTPALLDDSRLPEAITQVAEEWSSLTGVETAVTITGAVRHLDPDIEVTLLRVAQEALTNIGKHANATSTHVTLSFMDSAVSLDVRDDGSGFDPTSERNGFGLGVMRQRVDVVAGEFDVESEPGHGTVVSAIIPVQDEEHPGE